MDWYPTDWKTDETNLFVSVEKHRQCWQSISDTASGSCPKADGPILDRPPVRISYQPASCPFSKQTCPSGLAGFQVNHENFTFWDYGWNVKPALRHTRRLTCTPLDLHVVVDEIQTASWDMKQEQTESGRYRDPHRSIIAQSNRTSPLTIHFYNIGSRTEFGNCERLYDYFQRDEKETFFFVLDKNPRHRPLFAILLDQPEGTRAFTALEYDLFMDSDNDDKVMCQERHRICLDTLPGRCTQFDNISNAFDEMLGFVLDDDQTTKELRALYEVLLATSTATIVEVGINRIIHPWAKSPSTLWTSEVMRWFEGAFLLTRLNIHGAITGQSRGFYFENSSPNGTS